HLVTLSRPIPVRPIPSRPVPQGPPDGGATDVYVPRHRHLDRRADARLPLCRLHVERPTEPSLPLRRSGHAAAGATADRYAAGVAAATLAGGRRLRPRRRLHTLSRRP